MTQRKAQVESALKRAIGAVLAQKLADPRLDGMISVTRVTVSPDFHDAYVYVSVLPAKHQSRVIYGLRHASVHIYSKVCQQVDMKRVPHLDFRLDESIKKQADVLRAIDRGMAREQNAASRAAETPVTDPAATGLRPGEADPQ